jgi:hypothetical protein
MELHTIQLVVDECASILSDKGYQVFSVEFDVVNSHKPRGYFSLSENGKGFSDFLTFVGDNYADEMLDYAWQMPSPAEKQKQRIHKQLLALLEAAREAEMPIDFLNPLTAMAERLASNALEGPKGYYTAPAERGDEIPF